MHKATEIAVRLTVIAALAYWCLLICRPFAMPLLLAAVIAVALRPVHLLLTRATGGRKKLAAVVFVLVLLAVLIAPTLLMVASFVDGAQSLVEALEQGVILLPPPPEDVADWPAVGRAIYEKWKAAAENLSAILTELVPHMKDVALWLASTLARTGLVIFEIFFAIIVAGIMLAYGDTCERAAMALGRRLGGEQGVAAVRLAAATINTIARGVVGVSILQAAMAALGLFLAGVPAAGVLTVAVLILTVAQITSLLVLGPVIVYLIATGAGVATIVLFCLWTLLITIVDGPLKAYFFSRGVDIPMIVIMIGALGGVLMMGIIGLFAGAVILAVGYKLLVAWTKQAMTAAA